MATKKTGANITPKIIKPTAKPAVAVKPETQPAAEVKSAITAKPATQSAGGRSKAKAPASAETVKSQAASPAKAAAAQKGQSATAPKKTVQEAPNAETLPVKAAPTVPAKVQQQKPAVQAQPVSMQETAKKAGQHKKSVLFAVSECQPFAATGGLGDVAGSLPVQLAKQGMDVSVVMPLYLAISSEYRKNMKYIGNFYVMLAWRSQYCGVFELKQNGVTYYFIDNEYYFKREGLYGHYDEAERYAFFSKAVVEFMYKMNRVPDILHLHDWQTGLAVVYLKTWFKDHEQFKNLKTVFTIHNIEYQGKFGLEIMEDILGVPYWARSVMEYDRCVNIMKAAIVCSDIVSTVSPTYAKEILCPEFSHGLHHIIESNQGKLRGILNGIDYDRFNPETDKAIFQHYSAASANNKTLNKVALQKMLNLTVDEDVPMIGIISRLVQHKGMDLIQSKLDEILMQKVQIVLLGKGESTYEWFFTDKERSYGNKMKAIIAYNADLSSKIYAACDMFLMPSKTEPCGLSQMIASRYGAVPIVRETGGLFDSIKDFGCQSGGNGYVFANYNGNDMAFVIRKAIEDYTDKAEWAKKVKVVMNKDFSWKSSALEYIKMYDTLLK